MSRSRKKQLTAYSVVISANRNSCGNRPATSNSRPLHWQGELSQALAEEVLMKASERCLA